LSTWLGAPATFLDYTFSIPTLQNYISTEEHASLSLHTVAPLPWPFTQYQLSAQQVQGDPTSFRHATFLVARNDAPSYRSIQFAINDFIFGISSDTAYGLPLLVRMARTDAWIEHVHLTPTAMTIDLAGDAVAGCRLELLAEGDGHQATTVATEPRVEFPLLRGLPARSQLLLSREGAWRDDRFLDPVNRQNRPDFSWDSGDRTTDIEALISSGEGAAVEFKAQVPAEPHARRSAMKTVAAFANGEGGVIVFGVEKEDGKAVGVSDAPAGSDTVSTLVRAWVAPVPEYELDVVPMGGLSLIVLTVRTGSEPPYGIRVNSELHYFVRRGGTTFPAEPHEVRAVVLARQPSQPAGGRRLGGW
jgi:hypothetical protein